MKTTWVGAPLVLIALASCQHRIAVESDVGLTLDSDGRVVVLFAPCRDLRSTNVELAQSIPGADDTTVWSVAPDGPQGIDFPLTIGERPEHARELLALERPL